MIYLKKIYHMCVSEDRAKTRTQLGTSDHLRSPSENTSRSRQLTRSPLETRTRTRASGHLRSPLENKNTNGSNDHVHQCSVITPETRTRARVNNHLRSPLENRNWRGYVRPCAPMFSCQWIPNGN